MKSALFILGGIVAVFVFGSLSVLSIMLAQRLFGEVWGIGIWGLTMGVLGGGMFGWLVYRIRNPR